MIQMEFFRVVFSKDEHDLLLRSLGDSSDNAPDDITGRAFDDLFDLVKSAKSVEADDIPAEGSFKDKVAVGRAGNAVLQVMRQLVQAEAKGNAGDVSWYNHELCAMLRGFIAVGWNVTVVPQPDGFFRCVDIEGMRFKV